MNLINEKDGALFFFNPSRTSFMRFSKSPRYLVPANNAPKSNEYTVLFDKCFGALPSTIILAIPSTIAVLPTPGSPTNNGLFLRRRLNTCKTCSITSARPINGSILPCRAFSLRLHNISFSSDCLACCCAISSSNSENACAAASGSTWFKSFILSDLSTLSDCGDP